MIEQIKESYKLFRNGEPGKRFIQFHREKKKEERRNPVTKAIHPFIAIVLIVAGALLSIPPGVPGFILVLLGLGYLGIISRGLAKCLDHLELTMRGYKEKLTGTK
jgi:hypothetical protein